MHDPTPGNSTMVTQNMELELIKENSMFIPNNAFVNTSSIDGGFERRMQSKNVETERDFSSHRNSFNT